MSSLHRLIPRRRGVLLVVALALLATACGTKTIPPPPTLKIAGYSALGDSYAAGAGISPVANADCYRSGANYASLIASDVTVTDFQDVTCGGATTSNLLQSQTRSGQIINSPQLDAVNKNTSLVTLGIGLNDTGLSIELIYVCLPQLGLKTECARYLHTPDSVLRAAIDHVVSQTKLALEAIRKKAPKATIVLVGYPHALPDKGSCTDILPLTGKAATRLRNTLAEVNIRYQQIAKDEGVDYLDMYAASEGHDMCSDTPWVNGAHDGGANGAPLHPTPAFEREVANRIEALVAK